MKDFFTELRRRPVLIWIIVISFIIGCVTACDCGCNTMEDAPPEKALMVGREDLRVQAGYDDSGKHMKTESLHIYKWMYEGHYYLEFRHYGTDGPGWVHDPNCPCHGTTKNGTNSDGLSEYQKLFGGF